MNIGTFFYVLNRVRYFVEDGLDLRLHLVIECALFLLL